MLPISETTKVSKAQQKAVHKYVKNNYDRIELTVPKGHKAEIKAHADSQEESVKSRPTQTNWGKASMVLSIVP